MKTKRFCGSFPKVMHAAPEYLIANNPFSVIAACRAFGENAPEKLVLSIEGGKDFYLIPYYNYERRGVGYTVYRADVPASAVVGDRLSYRIDIDGEKNDKVEPYSCRIIAAESMPELPPLTITEIYGRPKGLEHTVYVEVFNPTANVHIEPGNSYYFVDAKMRLLPIESGIDMTDFVERELFERAVNGLESYIDSVYAKVGNIDSVLDNIIDVQN